MHRELVQVDGSGVVVDNELGVGLFVGQVLDLELWVLEADEIVVSYIRCSEVIGESLDLNPSLRVEVLDSVGLLTVVARSYSLHTNPMLSRHSRRSRQSFTKSHGLHEYPSDMGDMCSDPVPR
jgi:hypothetical protein